MKSRTSECLIIAHRGYSKKFPENTLSAFAAAIESHCDMIELDVHFSQDKEIVVIHDYHLGRTIKAKGSVDSYTLFQLRSLGVPSLRDVFSLVNNRVQINVEIKHESLKSSALYQEMGEKILSLIEEFKNINHVLISSFDEQMLRVLRNLNAQIRLGILEDRWEHTKVNLAREISAYSYHPDHHHLDQEKIQQLHSMDLKVFPYTLNTFRLFKKFYDLEVDGIITNDVEELYQALFTEKFQQ